MIVIMIMTIIMIMSDDDDDDDDYIIYVDNDGDVDDKNGTLGCWLLPGDWWHVGGDSCRRWWWEA
jgi:hypothetical protein